MSQLGKAEPPTATPKAKAKVRDPPARKAAKRGRLAARARSQSSEMGSGTSKRDGSETPSVSPARTATSCISAGISAANGSGSAANGSGSAVNGGKSGTASKRRLNLSGVRSNGTPVVKAFELTLTALQGSWRHSISSLGILTVQGQ